MIKNLLAAAGSSTVAAAVETDPYFSNVVLLLHMDGADNGTTFTDSSPSPKVQYTGAYTGYKGHGTASVVAATTSTSSPKYGTACAYAGAVNSAIAFNTSDISLGTDSFTVEWWMNYQNAVDGTEGHIMHWYVAGSPIISCGATSIGGTQHKVNWYDGTATKISTTSVDDGNWHHVALVRNGSLHLLFVDGVLEASATHAPVNYAALGQLWILAGYHKATIGNKLDDLRITKGIARYTNNFTPPTKAFPDTGLTTEYDPFFDDTVLLLHMDGSDNGTTFTDSSASAKAITRNGDTKTVTATKKYGTASAYFDGTGDYLSYTAGALSGDLTVEAWVNTSSTKTYQHIVCNDGVGLGSGDFRIESGTNISVWTATNQNANVASAFSADGNWHHIAFSRGDSTSYVFVDGVLKMTSSALTGTFNFDRVGGSSGYSSEGFLGYIDDVRVSSACRYRGGTLGVQYFTPPTKAFPDTGGYATWNPSDKSANATLSNGNLTTTTTGANSPVRATQGKASGKWYWEIVGQSGTVAGAGNSTASLSDWPGKNVNSWGYFGTSGVVYYNNTNQLSGPTFTTTDTIGIALDMDNAAIYFYKNNALVHKGVTGISGTWYPMAGDGDSGASWTTANFGQNPLKYTPPNGTFWNPKDADSDVVMSNNNLTETGSNSGAVRANTGKSSGKFYWECTVVSATSLWIGVGTISTAITSYPGNTADSYAYNHGGSKYNNGSSAAYGATFSASDVIGVALDLTNGRIYFSKNGVWQNSGDPVAGTGYAYNGLSGTYYPINGHFTTGVSTLNTGATPFAYSPPSGYSAWDSTVYNAGVY